MLVLSRKRGERIQIDVHGVEITLEVVDFRGHKVRLGFEAPHDVKIIREELGPIEKFRK